jgi:predicted nuclease of predicted toxin-antitoxin system
MKFKIDENLPLELAEFLRNEGYDAITVIEQDLSGNLWNLNRSSGLKFMPS